MKESFQPRAYRDPGIKNPASICLCVPSARSVSGILSEAGRRCVRPSADQQVLTEVCRPAACDPAMTGAESLGKCPACGFCSAGPGSHILCQAAEPASVFSVCRPGRSGFQRCPTVFQPALFHFLRLRLMSRTGACRSRRQWHELSVLFLYIRSQRHHLRLFPERTCRRPMPGSIRSGLKVRQFRTAGKKFRPVFRLPPAFRADHGQRISDSAAPRPARNTASLRLAEPAEWCSGLSEPGFQDARDLSGAGGSSGSIRPD